MITDFVPFIVTAIVIAGIFWLWLRHEERKAAQ